jgi:hypothetical protein
MTNKDLIKLMMALALMKYHFDNYGKKYTKAEYKQNKELIRRFTAKLHIYTSTLERERAGEKGIKIIKELRHKYKIEYKIDFFIAGCWLIDYTAVSKKILGTETRLIYDVIVHFRNTLSKESILELDLMCMNVDELLEGEPLTTREELIGRRDKLKELLFV